MLEYEEAAKRHAEALSYSRDELIEIVDIDRFGIRVQTPGEFLKEVKP